MTTQSSKPIFEVIVGNIGTVYAGNNFMVAGNKFNAYVKQSKQTGCRASGEDVTMLHNGEVRREYRLTSPSVATKTS